MFQGEPLVQNAQASRLRRQHFGFVFQQFFLINYLSALGNVIVGAFDNSADTQTRARQLLDLLGVGDLGRRKPYELSQGQRQRVAIARALVNDPQVVFVDEPTANIDHASGKQVMELLKKQKYRGAIVVVSHDETVLQDADEVYRMWDGQMKSLH